MSPATISPPDRVPRHRHPGGADTSASGDPRRLRLRSRRRDERGLASQEWLLLIAAVASFTALAVFVLAETIDDAVSRAGAEQPAREASAVHAARLVEIEAKTVTAENWKMHFWGEWETYFDTKCNNIENAFGAHGIEVESAFERPTDSYTSEADPMIDLTDNPKIKKFVADALATADPDSPQAGKPQVKCGVDVS